MNKKSLFLFIIAITIFSCKSKELTAKELINNGLDSAAIGNYKASIRLYSDAIKRDPWLKKGFYLRGKVRVQAGEYQLAMKDFEKTEKLLSNGTGYIMQRKNILNPEDDFWEVDYYDLLFQKGIAYVYLDSLKNAYGYFQYLINNHYRETSSCFFWKGEIMLATGDSVKACSEFMNAKLSAIESVDRELAEQYLKICKGKINTDTFLFYHTK